MFWSYFYLKIGFKMVRGRSERKKRENLAFGAQKIIGPRPLGGGGASWLFSSCRLPYIGYQDTIQHLYMLQPICEISHFMKWLKIAFSWNDYNSLSRFMKRLKIFQPFHEMAKISMSVLHRLTGKLSISQSM